MSQEAEDVKPKLNLNIAYDGTREFPPPPKTLSRVGCS